MSISFFKNINSIYIAYVLPPLLALFYEGAERTVYLFYVYNNSIDTMKATQDLTTSSKYILTLLTIFYEGEEGTLYLFYVSNKSIGTMKATQDLSTSSMYILTLLTIFY